MLWSGTLVLLPFVYGIPASYFLRKVAESDMFDNFKNYLPKYDDVPTFDLETNRIDDETSSAKTTTNLDTMKKIQEFHTESSATILPTDPTESTESSVMSMTTLSSETPNLTEISDTLEILLTLNSTLGGVGRFPRQELNETDDPEFAGKENESQEDASDEGNGNMITGLLSAFLGGLSRPDGGIDLDAIVGLLGSLSTQNPDGTYDFQGLTDLLQGFFGGGDEGGGSDIGAFVGGLLGAIIKGVANPPGPKGAGILTGKIVSGILPALTVPANTTDNKKPQEGVLDSGSFLAGVLKTIFGSSSGQGGGQINIVQSLITSVKSIFTSSSSKGRWR